MNFHSKFMHFFLVVGGGGGGGGVWALPTAAPAKQDAACGVMVTTESVITV